MAAAMVGEILLVLCVLICVWGETIELGGSESGGFLGGSLPPPYLIITHHNFNFSKFPYSLSHFSFFLLSPI
jgi:hypothetical protein